MVCDYDKQENWTNSEVNQLKLFAKKYDNTGTNSNRNIGVYSMSIQYKWGVLVIDKCEDEWYLVDIEFWREGISSDKQYWICDQFDSLLDLLDHLSFNLNKKFGN